MITATVYFTEVVIYVRCKVENMYARLFEHGGWGIEIMGSVFLSVYARALTI